MMIPVSLSLIGITKLYMYPLTVFFSQWISVDINYITLYHQMKFWYIKRFIHPDAVRFYEYVCILAQ